MQNYKHTNLPLLLLLLIDTGYEMLHVTHTGNSEEMETCI